MNDERALVVIDMQRWMFRTPERMRQAPGLCANTNALVAAFERSGTPIYDVRTEHKADRSTWSRLMLKHDYACLIEGTPDADPIPGFALPTTAVRVVKHANSAFLGTDFEEHLRRAGIQQLVLCGVFLDGCVGLTAADAAQRGYEVTFVDDAIGDTGRVDRREILRWLVDDYHLTLTTASVYLDENT